MNEKPLKIGIIGFGFVGKSVAYSFAKSEKHSFKIFVVDPAYDNSISVEELKENCVDAIFICVPTPTVNGKSDASLVLDYVNKLKDYDGLLVVKSTTVPSTVAEILKIREKTIICPEFLREKHYEEDALDPNIIVVGAKRALEFNAFSKLMKKSRVILHTDDGRSKLVHVSPRAAAFFKYFVNSFLALKVLFVHEFVKELADTETWNEMKDLFALEGRVGSSHLNAPGDHGWGFGGSCFPKDTEALLSELPNLQLLAAAVDINKRLRDGTI